MVLNNILSSLKLSTRRLKAARKAILVFERQTNTITTPGFMDVHSIPSLRTYFENALADLSLAASLVAKYQAVLRGIPLDYDSAIIDRYAETIESEGESGVVQEFMGSVGGGTGLEWYLCGQDSGSSNIEDWATEEEIFATYRAIGSIGFTEFELGVHRAVWKAEETAMELSVKFEEMVNNDKMVKDKQKGAKKSVKKVVKKAKK